MIFQRVSLDRLVVMLLTTTELLYSLPIIETPRLSVLSIN